MYICSPQSPNLRRAFRRAGIIQYFSPTIRNMGRKTAARKLGVQLRSQADEMAPVYQRPFVAHYHTQNPDVPRMTHRLSKEGFTLLRRIRIQKQDTAVIRPTWHGAQDGVTLRQRLIPTKMRVKCDGPAPNKASSICDFSYACQQMPTPVQRPHIILP